jgi:hypothetical protein
VDSKHTEESKWEAFIEARAREAMGFAFAVRLHKQGCFAFAALLLLKDADSNNAPLQVLVGLV